MLPPEWIQARGAYTATDPSELARSILWEAPELADAPTSGPQPEKSFAEPGTEPTPRGARGTSRTSRSGR